MHAHHIEEMVAILIHDGAVSQENAATAVSSLQSYWTTKIALVWSIDDVAKAAKNLGKAITEEQALDVLEVVFEDDDCSGGVNWTTLERAIERLID